MIHSWFNRLVKIDAQSGRRAFMITDVTYDTDAVYNPPLRSTKNLPTKMVADAEDLGLEDSDTKDDIREKIANWISKVTGLLVKNFEYHVQPMESQNE